MKQRWSAIVLPLLLCLATNAGALVAYNESTEAQFTAGSHNSTYLTGTGSNVNLGLDYYGHAGGLSAPGANEWYNSGWKYRLPLTVNSSNPSTLTNYLTAITFNTQAEISAGRMNADGSDIRFTTAAAVGTAAALSYYIESGINTSSTRIWVKVPSVANGANPLYMYFGSTSAASVSSMANTFVMGNNFTGADGSAPSTSTLVNIESAAPASGSLRDIQSNQLRLLFGSPLNMRYYGMRSASQYSFAAGRHYHADITARTSGADSWSSITLTQGFDTNSYSQEDWLRFSIKHSASGASYALERSRYATKITLNSGAVGAGVHSVDLLVNLSSVTVLLDGSPVYSGANDLTFNSPYVYIEAASDSASLQDFIFDNISVQPYSTPEPSFGAPGPEEGRRYPSGAFTSQVYDSSSTGANYQNLDWEVVNPSSSSVSLELRANDTNISLSTFTAVAKGGNPAIAGRYVQYRVNFATLDPRYTATVSSVTLTYGSPPLAPTGAAGTALSQNSIQWSWNDNSSGQYQEDGFRILDSSGVLKGSVGSGTTYWVEAPLNPNTQYSRLIVGYNLAGNGMPTSVSKYTLPAPPSIACDKSTATWLSGTITCSNTTGWGNNGVTYYRYVWSSAPTYPTWVGNETQWASGTLPFLPGGSGEYYLHVKSYNADGASQAAYQADYGPYWWDKQAPSIISVSPSSSPWTNVTGAPVQAAISDAGGSTLKLWRYQWTTTTGRPGSGWLPGGLSIINTSSSTLPFNTPGTAAQWYLHIEVDDQAGNTGYAYSGPYKLDLTPPGGSILINGGDTYTPQKDVVLSLTYTDSESGPKEVLYRNVPGSFTAPELPQATSTWSLLPGDGNKTVAFQVKDNAGNMVLLSDTIQLDSRTTLLGAGVSQRASGVMGETAETFNASANLSWTPTGAVLAGRSVTFVFRGSTQTVGTDQYGNASAPFNVPTTTGTYNYSVYFSSFVVDGIYTASNTTGTITATQRQVSVITEDVNGTSNTDFTAKATLKDLLTGNLIVGGNVTFVFQGSTKTAVTNGIGVATVTFTAPIPVGFYDYTASYDGDATYAANSASSRIGVGLRVTSLIVPGLSPLALADFTAQATLMDGAVPVAGSTITFVFRGSTETAVTNGVGVATVTFTAPASSGSYTYTADFAGDATYAASGGSGSVSVGLRPLTLAGDIVNGYVNATFQARAVLSDGINSQKVPGKAIVFLFEGSSATVVTDGNGVSTAVFNSGSLPRASTCYYYFAGDAGYGFADSTGTINIARRPVALAASDTSGLLSSTFTASAELKDTAFTPVGLAGKTITFSFNGSTQTAVTNSIGVATVTYQTGISTGAYDFYASFDQDAVYVAAYDTGTVTMSKRPSALTAYPTYVSALNTIKLVADLKDGISGAYISSQPVVFNYDGVPQSTTTGASSGIAGRANAVYPSTGVAGTYSFYVDFAGNSLYDSNSSTASIVVSQRSVNLSAFPQTAIWGSTFTATAEFRDGTTNAVVNGKLIKLTFSTSTTNSVTAGAGLATSTFTAPASTGTFNWLAEFAGDQAYGPASSTGTLTINRRAPTLTAIAANKYVWDDIYFSATFMDDGTPIPSKQLSFYFNSSTKTANTDSGGTATSLAFSSVSVPGTYNYTVSFAGDTGYSAQTSSSTLSVSARPSTLSLGPVSVIANSSVTLSASLTDTNNGTRVMSGKNVSFTLQGATYTVAALTDASGIARAVYTSSSATGDYTYSATFAGNTNYSGTSSSNTLTVTLRPTVLEMADYYPPASSTFTASAVLKDFTTGVTISTKTVSFLFLGSPKNGTTNSVGYASATYVTLSSTSSYPISASFAGDTLYSAASINKVVFPGRRNTALQTSDMLTAVAKDTFTLTARLNDYDLTPLTYIAGQTITFSFSGASTFTLTAVTDSTGIASVNFTAPVSTGNYTYTATFAGTSLYSGTLNTSSVLVNRRNISIFPAGLTGIPALSTFTASAVLKDGSITVSTKTLTFVFVTTKTAGTDGIGVASTTFAAPASTGTFSYAVSYPGDALYNPALAYGSVGVILKPTVMVVLDVPDAVVGLPFTGTAKLQDVELGSLVTSTKSITFTFTTSTLHAVTDLGVATTTMTAPLTVGTYTYTATFAGDGTYGASQSTGTVTVKRRPVIFSVDVPAGEPYTLSTFTVKGTLVDGKTGEALGNQTINIYFTVANATHTLVTDATGIATTTFYSGISSGNYVYSGTFDGDSSYNASEINDQTVKTIKINPRPTSIQPYMADGQLMTWGVYTFNPFNTTVVMQDNLNSNSGIPGLTVNFIVQGSTLTGVSGANGQATTGSAFPYIPNAGTYPATVRFDGNQTYAPSLLVGGLPSQIPLQGYVQVYQSPANIAMDSIQETYPDQDTIITGTAHDGYLGDRAAARPVLKGLQVRYRISDTPCNPYPTNCPWGTLGTPVWATVNDSYIATATVHSPTAIGDYPIERWFATTSSFYYWEVTEDKRVLRVGLRPTAINIVGAEPLNVGAQMPITITVKLASTSQGNIGVVGKPVVITFNGGAPQTVTTTAGGLATYTFGGLPVGAYTYTATFAGDSAYNAASLSPVGNVTVTKNVTFLTGTVVTNVPAGNDFTAKATLNILVGTAQQPAAGRTIYFTFPGNANANAVTNAQGLAQVNFTSPQVPGNYNYTADLPTNSDDQAASADPGTTSVQVVKRRTSLTSVAVNPVYIQDNFTSTATLVDLDAPPSLASLVGQTISFTLHRGTQGDISANGTTAASPLGQATAGFLSPAESGNKSYTASFAGDALYAAVTASDAGVNVQKRTTVLSAGVEPTTPTNTIFTATVTLRDNTPTLASPLLMGPGVHVPVKFVYNGVTNYGTTDDFGVATATFMAQAASNDYTCAVTYEGNTTYASYNLSLPVHVIKRTTHVTGTAILNQPAGAQFTAQATLTDDYSGTGIQNETINFVFTGGGTFNGTGTTDVSGITSALFTAPLSTGIYNYTACFPGDSTYAANCDNNNSVTVDVASTTLATPDGTLLVNNVFFATATLKGKESGVGVANKNVSFTYAGAFKGSPSTDINGITVQSFTPTATGTYELDVAFAGDAAFYPTTSSATITVNRRRSGIAQPGSNTEVDAVFVTTATLTDLDILPNTKVSGRTVDFTFNGANAKSAVTNSLGVATVTYTAPAGAGSYPVTASFAGDPIYISSATSAWVNVAKHDTNLTVDNGSIMAQEVFNATATLKWGLVPVVGRQIQFTYKGSVLMSGVTDVNGQAFLQYNAGSSSGPWRLDAAFTDIGDSSYNTSSGSNTITVLTRNCVVLPDNITMSVFDTFNATVTFKDVLNSSTPAGKFPQVAFNWISTGTASSTDGAGKAYRTALTAPSSSGTYKVEAWYNGDATYARSIASTATVTVTQRSTQLSVADVSTMFGRVFTATATLKNDTTLIDNEYVLFTFEGKNFNSKTGINGSGIAVATFTVTLSTGATQINAVFNGGPSYAASNVATGTVTAAMRPTTLTPIAATVIANKTLFTTATLTDIDGKNVSAEPVSFIFNSGTQWGNTNSLGVSTASFTANVATGAYSVPVNFAGDFKYITSSATLSVTVTRRPTTMTPLSNVTVRALDVFYATATLKDMDLNLLGSKPTRAVFQGSTFTAVTDGSGVTVSTWLAPAASGTYSLYVYFDGDPTYGTSTGTITVTVQQRPTAISLNPVSATALDLFKTTATLTDQNNPAFKVSTKTVTFSFSWGASTAGVTDGVGFATASYRATAAAGSYTLTGSFAGDSTFASTTTTVAFPVAKRDGYVTGVFVSTRVFDVFTASGTFYDSVASTPVAGRTLKFSLQNVSTLTATTNGSGIAAVSFTAPAASGTYSISIWSDGSADPTYNQSSVYQSSVTLARRNSSITLTGPTASIINSSFTAGGTLADSLAGGNVQSKTISFLFQAATVPATTDASGFTSTGYTANSSSGTYQLQASFAGDSSYNPSVSVKSISMLRYPTAITAPSITATMNEVLTATATLKDYKAANVPSKDLVFYFQTSSFTSVTNGSGVAYSTYSAAVASGTYQLPVSFAGDALYDSTNTSIPVLINKRSALLTPDPVTVKALDIFTATATLVDYRNPSQKLSGQTVSFHFLVGGSTFANSGVTDVNGIAVSTFTAPSSIGPYQVLTYFSGDPTYYPTSVYGAVTVTARPAKLMLDNASAAIDEVFRTTATLVDQATLAPIPGEAIDFTFGASSSGVTGTGGKATVTFTAPSSSGPAQMNASFAGDSTYAAASSTATLAVSRRPITMSAPDAAAVIDEVFTATVTVTDGLNTSLVSGRQVAFVFYGSTFTAVTAAGVAYSTFAAPPSSGTYYAAINFAGDARYLPAGTTVQVAVDRRMSAILPDPVSVRAGDIFTATATLSDVGNPSYKASGRPLKFVFAGSTFTALTDSNGVAVSTFSAPSSSGTARLDISFAGDSRYQASASSATVTVLRRLSNIFIEPANIRAMDVLTATATLTDKMNPGVFGDGRLITFTFSAQNFASVTDAAGIAVSTFAGPVSSGTYLVEASFPGDAIYENAYASGTVTVTQRPSGITVDNASAYPFEELIVSGTMKDAATQNAVNGRSLLFNLNGTQSSALTSPVGVATAAYTPPGTFGNYQLSADFAGDATYAATNATGTISVMQRPTSIATLPAETVALEVFTASATLTDVRLSSTVAGKDVVFLFEGQSSTGTTDANGLATAHFSAPLSSGVYAYTAVFNGDAVYAVYSATGAVTVGTRYTRVVARDANANVGEPFTLTAQLLDPAKEDLPGYYVPNVQMKFTFKDRNNVKIDEGYAMTNELGIATITFSGPGAPDVYYYTAAFEGNVTYSSATATAMLKVGLLTSLVAFDATTMALENFPVKAKLTDYLSTTLDDKPIRFKFLGNTNTALTYANGISGVAEGGFTAPASSGTYYYNAYFDGDSIYSASNATGTITVTLRKSYIQAPQVDTLANSSFTATITLKDVLSDANIGGRNVDISFNGSTVPAVTDLTTGRASATFFAVSTGTLYYAVSYEGDGTYSGNTTTGTVNVTLKPTTMLSYEVTNVMAASTFTAKVQVKDGYNQPIKDLDVDFSFEGNFNMGITDAQGIAQAVFTAPASSGTYQYHADFYGDFQYSASSASGNVTVGPRQTLIFTSAVSSKLGTPLNLTAKLLDVANQTGIAGKTLSFVFEGTTVTAVTDSLGISTAVFGSPASTGSYIYEASYDGDGFTFTGSYSSAAVSIALNLTTLEAKTGVSIKIYEPLDVDAKLKDSIGLNLPGMPVVFTLQGIDQTAVTDDVGLATTTFQTLGFASTGTYNYTAQFLGDSLYVASSDTSNVVNVNRRDTLLIAKDQTVPAAKAFTAEAKLLDNVGGSLFMGAPIQGKTIIFELYDSTFTQVLSSATSTLGVSTVTFISPVSTGTFLLTARFADDDPVYIGAISSAVISVLLNDGTGAIKTKMKTEAATAYINKVFVASGTLTATDVPVPDKAVLFEFFNGIATYTAAGFTDSIGLATASFTAPASSGVYSLTASFAGDMDFSAATGTSTLTANRYPDSLTAQAVAALSGEDFPAKAVLKDELTQAFLPGKTVTFTFFNGISTVTKTAVTSSTGSAETTFTSPSAPGDYTYTALFAGDTQYISATDTASILIASKGSSTFLVGYDVFIGTGEVFAASATITSKGYAVPGKPIAITFQGLTRISTSNAQGLVFSTFTAPASSGTFSYQAEFTGDPDYNATLATAAVSVVMRKVVEQPVFKVEVTSTVVTLAWTPVSVSSAQVTGYTIEQSASLRGVSTSSAAVASSTAATMGYAVPVDEDQATYIKIKTKLADNQESQTSLTVEIPSKAEDPDRVPNYYYMSPGANPQDWAAWVKVPGKVMDKVSANAPFAIDVKKEVNPNFMAAYTITASGSASTLSEDLKASDRKGVKLTIAYPPSGTVTSAVSGQLAIYWFNGVEWVKLGGEIDVLTGELYTYSRVLGQFAVKAAPLASSFTLTKVAPRIFSPDETDTNVNRARFYFENPDFGEVTIRIFDITGALVRRNLESEGGNIMFWNGKDQSGTMVRGGVYIYQIEASDKVLTGTVVVAK